MEKSSCVKDCNAFASNGNCIDVAVGVVSSGAFGKMVSSVVGDIIMTIIGVIVGGVNFTTLKWVIRPEHIKDGNEIAAISINYGNFIQVTIDFLIISFSIFLFIKLISNFLRTKEEPAAPPTPPAPSQEEVLLTEIRDVLKEHKSR